MAYISHTETTLSYNLALIRN